MPQRWNTMYCNTCSDNLPKREDGISQTYITLSVLNSIFDYTHTQISDIEGTWGNQIFDHWDLVGAAPTTSLFSI